MKVSAAALPSMLWWLWFLVLGLGQCQQPGQQQEKDLAVRLGGFGDYLVLEDGGTIASPSSFTLELWHRPERKDRDDYEELCLVSKGSWEGSSGGSIHHIIHMRTVCAVVVV